MQRVCVKETILGRQGVSQIVESRDEKYPRNITAL